MGTRRDRTLQRPKRIHFLLEEHEYEQLQEMATRKGTSASFMVRTYIRRILARDAPRPQNEDYEDARKAKAMDYADRLRRDLGPLRRP